MRSRWELWTSTTRGKRLKLASNTGAFGLGRILNGIGEWYLDLPWDVDMGILPLENMVEFWRAPEGGTLSLICVGFIKQRERWTRMRRASGPDQNDILQTRINAYYAGTTDSEITDNYDDMMKHVMRANFGSLATDTDRDLSSYNFTIAPDASDAPSGTLGFAWSNTLNILQKIADASKEAGTELYYDLIPVVQSDQSIGFEFRTYTSQIQDRTEGSENPVYFGEQFGNVLDGHVVESAREEVNYVYAGGKGEESDRVVVELSNATRIGRSPWNRREGFVNYSNTSDTDTLISAAYAEINDRRPRRIFTGQIVDTPKARFGVDWGLGYRVTCNQDGEQFDALIKQVDIEVANEEERISVTVEVEE